MTNPKTTGELLEREKLLLRSLIDSIHDLIFYKDVHGVYLGWNRAFQDFSGVVDDPSKKKITDLEMYPAERAQQFIDTDRRVLESGKPLIFEMWTADSSGIHVLHETQKTPYYDPDGKLLGVIGIVRDITRHYQMESALRAANLEIEQLISSLSSALIAVTPDLRVTRWNPKAEKVFDLSSEKALNQTLEGLELTWEWRNVEAAFHRCQKDRRAVYMDPVPFKRSNNTDGYLGINISPVFDDNQIVIGFILLCGDITERKTMESRLVQSQKLESIGQLAAGIAHEINTPIQYVGNNTHFLQRSFISLMQVINSYQEVLDAARTGVINADLLDKADIVAQKAELDFLTNEIPAAIDQTINGINRVAEIVQSMRNFSHPGVVKKTAVNINKALLDTLVVARNTWKYVAEIETDLDPQLPDVICLAGEINQVFLNIILNAADALAEKFKSDSLEKGLIRVNTRLDGNYVDIRITDTGPGVPLEIRGRIFEPFFTTKEVGKGTGQGLAIAYDIVEHKHHGTLTFITEVGQGTTFIIRLPVGTTNGEENEREDPIR